MSKWTEISAAGMRGAAIQRLSDAERLRSDGADSAADDLFAAAQVWATLSVSAAIEESTQPRISPGHWSEVSR
jgi:hypothetical protein